MLASPYFAEYKRNIWLEFTKGRLIILGIVAALAYLIGQLQLSDDTLRARDAQDLIKFYLNAAIFIGLLWGVSRVVDSIREEINAHTWDFQRLSALPPFSLLFGKIFGGAAFALFTTLTLYGIGLFLLLAYPEGSVTQSFDKPQAFSWRRNFTGFEDEFLQQYLQLGLISFLSLMLAYLAAFAATVQMARGLKNKKKFGDALLKGSALLVGAAFIYPSMALIKTSEIFNWYSADFTGYGLILYLLSFCILWALYAGYQNMRGELQFSVTPFGMILFAVTSVFVMCGFLSSGKFLELELQEQLAIYAGLCFCYFLALSLFLCFTENISLLRYRKTIDSFKSGKWATAWTASPRWTYLFALTILSLFLFFAFSIDLKDNFVKITLVLLNLLFFSVRDLAIWHILNFKNPMKAHHITFIIYLIIAYGALPYLLSLSTNDHQLVYILVPDVENFERSAEIRYHTLFPPLAQATLALGYLVHFLQTKARKKQ